jgi:dTDP-4-dehydrorhamnose 3,5-epimerase
MSRFRFFSTPIIGLSCVERRRVEDHRGYLSRLFCSEEFAEAGHKMLVAQINQTLTRRKGTVRGMHFQFPPATEIKLVTCTRGRVFDVALDLRADSSTFLQWHGEVLSSDNRRALVIPAGFAHGFQALEDDCELIYLHSAHYQPESECAINACDPSLKIEWPILISEMSDRDRGHPMLKNDFQGILL